MRNIQQHFSIRKLTVGAASVLIGISFLATTNTNQVHADTLDKSVQTQQIENKQADNSATAKDVQEISLQNVKTNSTATADSLKQSTDTQTVESTETSVKNTTRQETKSTGSSTDLIQNSGADSKAAASSSNTVADDADNQSSNKQNVDLSKQTQNIDKSTFSSAPQEPKTETKSEDLADKNTTTLNVQKTQAKIQVNLAENKIEKLSDSDELSAVLKDGTSISLNRNTIGATGDTSNVTIRIDYHDVKQGDIYTINIPTGLAYHLDNPETQKLQVFGSTEIKNENNNSVIINTFNKSTPSANVVSQIFNLVSDNNYGSRPVNMAEIGEMVKKITIDKKGMDGSTDSASVNLKQIIAPEMNPTFKRIVPDSNIDKIYPNTDYTYELSINETDGLQKGISYASGQINSTSNWGTTITIPVPPDFVLNLDQTALVNYFKHGNNSDQTTIKQVGGKGGNIIIDIPKGSGRQGWEEGNGYRLVGYYEGATSGSTSASGQITIRQLVTRYDGSTYYIDKTLAPWSEKITTGNADALSDIQINISGYSPDDTIPTDVDPTRPINSFSFKNINAANIENPHLTFNFDDHMQINRIETPADKIKLPGTTTYQYQAVLSNGQTISGSIDAGKDLTTENGVYIKHLVLTPNVLAAGAGMDIRDKSNLIKAYGTLDSNLKDGDKITTRMGSNYTITLDGQTVTKTINPDLEKIQTVKEKSALFGAYAYQARQAPGSMDSGYISIYRDTHSGDATTQEADEPIFYYVLPKYTAFNKQIGIGSMNSGAKVPPKITSYVVDGREVVKIDFTGTGDKISTMDNANMAAHIDISALAKPGSYKFAIYVESPNTLLTNGKASDSSFFNPDFTQGKTNRVYEIGNGQWTIGSAIETGIVSGARGNQNSAAVKQGTSDDKGSTDMAFDFNVINRNQQINNVTAVIDLTDHNNNAFDFRLTKPVTVEEKEENDHTQILYSTDKFIAPSSTIGAQPDLSSFKTADQMSDTDWANVKTIAFKISTLKQGASSSAFRIHGQDANLVHDAGKSYSYSTYLFGDGVSPSYTNSSSNPSITISGKSTIKYQVHYTDQNGQEHTVALDDLNKTYNDGQDHMPSKNDVENAFANYVKSHGPNSVIPANYKLGKISIVNGTKTWKADIQMAPNDSVNFGDLIQYFADSDAVQFDLVLNAKGSVKVVYHDDTSNVNIAGYGYDSGQLFDGDQVNYANNDIETAKAELANKGYIWKTTDGSLPTTIAGNQNITVTVHFIHGTVNIDKDHPAGKYTGDDLQKSATRTINYVDRQGNKLKNSGVSTVVFNASGVLDKVSGNLVNLNNDGSIKDQNGALHWTYVVDGGSAQTGDSYNFDAVPVENTLSYDGGTYRFDHVDPNTELDNNAIKCSTVSVNNSQNQIINVVYDLITYHVGEPVTQTVKRTINYLDGNDHSKTVAPQVVQKATLSRTQIIDNKGNIIGWGSVSSDGKSYTINNSYKVDNGWIDIDSPDLSNEGYKPASVAEVNGAPVDENTNDTVVNVYYDHQLVPVDENSRDKHGVASDQLGKDVNETVHFVYTNGTKAKDDVIQTRHFTRTVTIDAVTNEIVPNGQYDINWHLGNGEKNDYAPVAVNVINGYYADQASIPGQTVTQDNIEKTVTYKKLGHVVAVDKDGNVIVGSDSPQFINDPSDPTKALGVDAPTVTNYHLASGQSSHVEPDTDLSQDVKVIYDKDQGSVKVVFHDDTTDQDLTGVGYDSGNADFDTPITYITEQDLDNLGKKGYVYVSTDGVIPDKITANQNTTIIVHMRHGVVEITGKTPIDQVPANTVEAAQPNKLTKEVTLTVNYVNNDGTLFTGTVPANAHQTITFNGTAYVDAVTGQIVNAKQENGQLEIDEDNTKTPAVIWTSDKTSFDKVISPAENGYHVISVSDHKDGNDVGVIDGINFDSANIEVTVTYAPDPKSEPEPQPEPQPEPDNKPDDNKPTPTPDNKPDNTIVPKGETDNGENKPNEVKRADKKAHKSVEKGNGAVVKGADKPTKSNAKQPGTKQGHIDDNSTSKVTKSPRKAAQAKTESKSTNRKAALPQTGEKTTSLAWLGLGLASLATIIDLAGDRKRR
ncbi:mucin-binding protein [Lactobacillus kitasatonis]|uniref:mucin-binding protein n=1 Tax=Lactobacillus kitasatonis TaxID=237446 RepID=UPI003F678087